MASRLCWENIEVGCDPYGPGNPICIANGVFAGTPVPVGGKYAIASKSPLTGFIGDSLSGSWFSIVLKRAQWDGIVIHGQSQTDLHHGRRRSGGIFPADKLMGLGTYETEERSVISTVTINCVRRQSALPVKNGSLCQCDQ